MVDWKLIHTLHASPESSRLFNATENVCERKVTRVVSNVIFAHNNGNENADTPAAK